MLPPTAAVGSARVKVVVALPVVGVTIAVPAEGSELHAETPVPQTEPLTGGAEPPEKFTVPLQYEIAKVGAN